MALRFLLYVFRRDHLELNSQKFIINDVLCLFNFFLYVFIEPEAQSSAEQAHHVTADKKFSQPFKLLSCARRRRGQVRHAPLSDWLPRYGRRLLTLLLTGTIVGLTAPCLLIGCQDMADAFWPYSWPAIGALCCNSPMKVKTRLRTRLRPSRAKTPLFVAHNCQLVKKRTKNNNFWTITRFAVHTQACILTVPVWQKMKNRKNLG